jgi:tetraacyldisaccharide 4'-kinase
MRPHPIDRLADWVPRWWAGQGGATGRLADTLLWPAERGYAAAVALRNAAFDRRLRTPRRAPIPVVSVGNLAVGGTGKTPVAAWFARTLSDRGFRPAVVLRGYGRDEIEVHRELNPDVPVLAAAERHRAVCEAAERGAEVAVLDDGFQHRALERDLDIVLVSAERWTARRRLLPRGPWRESVASLLRADLVAVTHKTDAARPDDVTRVLRMWAPGVPVVPIALRPAGIVPLGHGEPLPRSSLVGVRVLAVAALADPPTFAQNLGELGMLPELAAFRDHHEFSEDDVAALVRRAGGRPIVVSLKDAVKLRTMLAGKAPVWVARQSVLLPAETAAAVAGLLERHVGIAGP